MPIWRGTLFLVVGASGVGKDTLLEGARRALDAERGIHFARRIITRPAAAGGEIHEEASESEFAAFAAAGRFALAWAAHGHRYAIDRAIEDELAAGRHVVANVSRQVLGEARQRYAPLRIIEITAPPELLARRLAGRGREDAAAIAARLAREAAPVAGPEVWRIENAGSPADGIAALLAVLVAG